MTTRIVGIGAPAAGDDGVGLVVLDALEQETWPDGVELHAVTEPSQIVPLLAGADAVILVDAVLGGAPGAVLHLDRAALAAGAAAPVSSHGIGVAQALALAERLDPGGGPKRLDIIGVCIASPERGAQTLSAPVAAAVPRATSWVRNLAVRA